MTESHTAAAPDRRPEHGGISRQQFLRGAGALSVGAAAALTAGAAGAAATTPDSRARRAEPSGRFAERVVLITGATSGIGEATAYAFAREGAHVFFCGRRAHLGRENERRIRAFGGEATYLRADVRRERDVRRFVDGCVRRYGRIDIAFNNAGIETPTPGAIAEQPLAAWHDVMATNATGVFLSMRYEIPHMLERGRGVIVNNASVSGAVGFSTIAPYSASKHAVFSLTKVAALDYAARNIRVNSIVPGAVDTPMLQRAMDDWDTTREEIAADYPVGRLATAEEMARAVMWLASEDSAIVTGTNVDVTGGYLTG